MGPWLCPYRLSELGSPPSTSPCVGWKDFASGLWVRLHEQADVHLGDLSTYHLPSLPIPQVCSVGSCVKFFPQKALLRDGVRIRHNHFLRRLWICSTGGFFCRGLDSKQFRFCGSHLCKQVHDPIVLLECNCREHLTGHSCIPVKVYKKTSGSTE